MVAPALAGVAAKFADVDIQITPSENIGSGEEETPPEDAGVNPRALVTCSDVSPVADAMLPVGAM
jgi:hypothetical protein